jgi:hypothetical protein
LFWFFASLTIHAQQNDTIKHSPESLQKIEIDEHIINQDVLDAIRNGTFIGPIQEQRRSTKFSIDEEIFRDNMRDNLNQHLNNRDSIPATMISDRQIKELKALSKVYHKKTTVNDTQTLANPHISVSFNDFLCYLFRPDLRAKMRNKKKATAYKTY